MVVILWILAAILLLILVSGGYVFAAACLRRKELPWFDEQALQKTDFGKYYQTIQNADRWLREHHAQDVYVTSEDGLRLHGYWIPAEDPKGTVLLAHGYRSTLLVDFAAAFSHYHRMEMNILATQQRAHGESQGKFITFGVKESGDMACWVRYHNAHFGAFPMMLSGLSMGASTVLYMADMDLPDNVKCIVADCGFTSPKAILDKVYRSVIHMPSGPSLWAADLFARSFAGFRLDEKDTRITLKNAKLPVLLIHGLSDDFVPSYMSRQAFDACNGPKELFLVEGAGHGTSFVVDREGYLSVLTRFINKYLLG